MHLTEHPLIQWGQFPADFLLKVVGDEELPSDLPINPVPHASVTPPSTRRRYARIRAINTGVLTPSPLRPTGATNTSGSIVPFILILEPLYLGILPASVAPTIFFLIPVVALAVLAIPKANTLLSEFASLARKERTGHLKRQ